MATKSELAELNCEYADISMLKGAIEKGFDIHDWLAIKEATFHDMQRRACVFFSEKESNNNE